MLAFGHLKYSPPAEIQPSFTTAEQFAAGTAQLEAPVTEMACPAPEVLLAFSEGMLDSRAAADIDSHLRVCQDCCDLRNRLDSFERTISSPLETDRYQILHEIGRGGMGIVYCAHDRRKNRTVALKVIRPEIAADANSLRRLRNEVLLACTIRHPNVCRSYEFHRTSNSAFITMEYVDGVTLRKRLEHGPKPDLPEVLSIAARICDGLSELHKHQIIHRDLKPDNIMIERNGDVKLTDFGLALYLDPEATASAAAGTPAYMAPEQMAGLCVDQRADIYSLGLVLCELFSGRSPGFARVETSTHQAMSRWFTDACPHLPNVVREKLVQSLHPDVALRPQTVAEITAVLRRAS
jgi:serine/threonine protein kinase